MKTEGGKYSQNPLFGLTANNLMEFVDFQDHVYFQFTKVVVIYLFKEKEIQLSNTKPNKTNFRHGTYLNK